MVTILYYSTAYIHTCMHQTETSTLYQQLLCGQALILHEFVYELLLLLHHLHTRNTFCTPMYKYILTYIYSTYRVVGIFGINEEGSL